MISYSFSKLKFFPNTFSSLFFLSLLILFLFACKSNDEKQDYIKEINTQRSKKDAFFKYSDDSPLSFEKKSVFSGLNYFKIDPAYKVSASVEWIENPEMLYLQNSIGEEMRVYPYARLSFEIEGQRMSLLAFRHFDLWMYFRESGYVFLPFKDKTNNELTYSMGRYIDIELKNGEESEVFIDFNKAYNPFCAYNENVVCPYPPVENHLDVKVPAGEKKWED